MSFHVQAFLCVLSYKYKESTHFDFCLVKRVQRITVVRYTSVTPLLIGCVGKSKLNFGILPTCDLFPLIMSQTMITRQTGLYSIYSIFSWGGEGSAFKYKMSTVTKVKVLPACGIECECTLSDISGHEDHHGPDTWYPVF